MFERLTTFLFKSATGRILLVVAIAMGAAYAARVVLVDVPALREKEAAGVGAETLEQMGDSLAAALDEGTTTAEKLPALTSWYPANVPCASDAPLPQPRDAVWDVLGVPADASRTQFQYRFQMRDGAFEIRARRDRDCDGFYAVWLLEQRGSGVLGRELTAQNILE